MEETIYLIAGKDGLSLLFEGTIEQFKDCFFSNANEELMKDFAENNDCFMYKRV